MTKIDDDDNEDDVDSNKKNDENVYDGEGCQLSRHLMRNNNSQLNEINRLPVLYYHSER